MVVFLPFTRLAMDEELMQERIKLVMFLGKLKNLRVSLMKDYFSLLKAFSRSIFKIILACFPFIFSK